MENSLDEQLNNLPQINPLPGDSNDIRTPVGAPNEAELANEISNQNSEQNFSDTQIEQQIEPEHVNENDPEEEDAEEEAVDDENSIPVETILYYVRNRTSYEFETPKLEIDGEEKTGCWYFLTPKTAEKIVLEEWEDKFIFQYTVIEPFAITDSQKRPTDKCLYKELEIDPETDTQIFLLEEDLDNIKVQDHYLIKHDFIAKSLGIANRRFAVIEQGEIVCSADKTVVKEPKPENDEAGCFVYVTTILPEESVLQDWEDKTLNVYYFNEPIVLPYGVDNEPDEFFDEIYIDKVSNEDGTEERIFSYYDDNVMGEYLKNEPKTAEIFLVESDLKKLTYYTSYELRLDNIKFIHGVERPIYD